MCFYAQLKLSHRRTSIIGANKLKWLKFDLYCIFHIKALIDLLFVSNQVTQYCLILTYPKQHYLVLIRFQRKISLLRLLQFLSELKSTINMYFSFHIDNSKIKKWKSTSVPSLYAKKKTISINNFQIFTKVYFWTG